MTVESTAADLELGADRELDRLNVAQALKDFEIANRRVLDLTHRLAAANQELMHARSELSQLQARYGAVARYVELLRRTPLFPLAKALAKRTRMGKR